MNKGLENRFLAIVLRRLICFCKCFDKLVELIIFDHRSNRYANKILEAFLLLGFNNGAEFQKLYRQLDRRRLSVEE